MDNNNLQNISPQQPPINPFPPTPAKKLSNKIIAIILLAVIAGIVIWISLSRQPKTDLSPIVVNHKTETQPLTTTTPQTDLKNLKTYTNSQYQFSMDYPSDWVLAGEDYINIPNSESQILINIVRYNELPTSISDNDFPEGDLYTKKDVDSLKQEYIKNSSKPLIDIGYNLFGGNFQKKASVFSGNDLIGITLTFGQGKFNWSEDGPSGKIDEYQKKIENKQIEPEVQALIDSYDKVISTLKFTSSNWLSLSGCAAIYGDKNTPFTFSYPQDLPIDTNMVKQNCIKFDNIPDSYNLTLPVSNSVKYPIVEVSSNFKFVYFIKAEPQGNKTTYSLYRVDSYKKVLTLLDSYSINSSWDIKSLQTNGYYSLTPSGGQYILYNWFVKDPATVSKDVHEGDSNFFLAAKIKTAGNKLIFKSPCYLDFYSEVADFEISDDGKHFVFSCFYKDLYVGDWQSAKNILIPTPAKEAHNPHFKDNSHIKFQDFSKEVGDCQAQTYSVDLNGNNLKDEGTSYACF